MSDGKITLVHASVFLDLQLMYLIDFVTFSESSTHSYKGTSEFGKPSISLIEVL